jgi:DNA replication protein DnaC
MIDDFGLKKLPRNSGEHFFEVIMRRYENHATIMTSNWPLGEWGNTFGRCAHSWRDAGSFSASRAQTIAITGGDVID